MHPKGSKLTQEQRDELRKSHLGQVAWNKGTGGCKKGHDPSMYVCMPSGVFVCLLCKRENGKKYRENNRQTIRENGRVARYKVSIDYIKSLFECQSGKCAICGNPIEFETSRIDHDHRTGKVRGLLCVSCNTGIGLLQDSPSVLERAAEYIRENNV